MARKDKRIKRTILIICEGKTEKLYFKRFRHRRAPCLLKVESASTSDLLSTLKKDVPTLISRYDLKLNQGDEVYCVFDVDHMLDKDLEQVSNLARSKQVQITLSNPSFEFWFLLHFIYTVAPLTNASLIDMLKKYLVDYSKVEPYYDELYGFQNTALDNAKRASAYHDSLGRQPLDRDRNPETQVYRLVEHLNKCSTNPQ